MLDELLDIVDHNDCVVGQLPRGQIYAQKSHHFRVINAFIMNDRGLVWIPVRSAHKKLFPSCLDASVGGHVAAGESYEQAFKRETHEEVNIDVEQVSYEMVAKLTPQEHGVSAFMHLYIIRTNATPAYNTNDFASASWISLDDLQQRLQQGEPAKGDLIKLVQFLCDYTICSRASSVESTA